MVGSGVAATTMAQTWAAFYPNLKVIIVDSNEYIANTFLGDFDLNSTTRPSDFNTPIRPGRGNLNEIPGAPIQIPFFTEARRVESRDMCQALTIDLATADTVDLLLNTTANKIETLPSSQDGEKLYKMTSTDGLEIYGSAVVIASGLGKDKIPTLGQRASLHVQEQLALPLDDPKRKIYTQQDFARLQELNKTALRRFNGAKVHLWGDGQLWKRHR